MNRRLSRETRALQQALNRTGSRRFLGYNHSRRSFLAAAAGAGLLLPLLRRTEATAQGAPPPRRFLIIQRAVGTVRSQWLPAGAPSQTALGNLVLNTGVEIINEACPDPNAPPTTIDGGSSTCVTGSVRPAVQVGGVSAGFAPLLDKTTIIDGLDIVTSTVSLAADSKNGGPKTHEGGIAAIMTGGPSNRLVGQEDHRPAGASIDQILLAGSPLLQGTMIPDLHLGTDNRSDRDELSPRVMSYLPAPAGATAGSAAADAVAQVPEINPLAVYANTFGTLMAGAPGINEEALLRLRAERGSVIDYLERDLARLGALVPADERVLIDAHVAAIQGLEGAFNRALDAQGGVSVCAPIPGFDLPFAGWDPTVPADQSGNNAFHQQIGMLQLAIIRTAFACDFTRVATFMWSPGTNAVFFSGLYPGMGLVNHHGASHDNTESKEHDLVAIERWYTDRTVEALLEFDSVLETDGTTLLDNTVVPWITEVARGRDHDNINAPFAVIGGGALGIAGGRFYRADGPNRTTNALWHALAPVFDVDLPALGNAEQQAAALPDFVV